MRLQQFETDLPMSAGKLSGWGAKIDSLGDIYCGEAEICKPLHQEFVELRRGLALYIPSSGVTQVVSMGHKEIFQVSPGNAYLYVANSEGYQATMEQAGHYNGLKIFLNSAYLHSVQTIFAKRHLRRPDAPLLIQIQVAPATISFIAQLTDITIARTSEVQIASFTDGLIRSFRDAEQGHPLEEFGWRTQIEAADSYLREKIQQPPSVLGLANLVGLNHMTMKRGFRKVYDQTVYQRLRYWRMEKAKQLLKQGVSVTETAMEVGYSNPAKFAAAFANITQMNPSQWRSSEP